MGCAASIYPHGWSHPHVRGTENNWLLASLVTMELSPRARNRQHRAQKGGQDRGAIPACAGPTPATAGRWRTPWSHPRVRGGQPALDDQAEQRPGAIPRARRRPHAEVGVPLVAGAIPKCTGPTSSRPAPTKPSSSYPPVREASQCLMIKPRMVQEPSPHAQGRHRQDADAALRPGAIPTYAGSTRIPPRTAPCSRSYPRLRGADKSVASLVSRQQGLSPRAQGRRSEWTRS